jgi:hypothetical protein
MTEKCWRCEGEGVFVMMGDGFHQLSRCHRCGGSGVVTDEQTKAWDDMMAKAKTTTGEMKMGSGTIIAAFQEHAGLKPATGGYANILEQMSQKCFETIKIIELERSGIRDGDGYWHGSDVMGGTMQDIANLAKQTLEACTRFHEGHPAKPYAKPPEDDYLEF